MADCTEVFLTTWFAYFSAQLYFFYNYLLRKYIFLDPLLKGHIPNMGDDDGHQVEVKRFILSVAGETEEFYGRCRLALALDEAAFAAFQNEHVARFHWMAAGSFFGVTQALPLMYRRCGGIVTVKFDPVKGTQQFLVVPYPGERYTSLQLVDERGQPADRGCLEMLED